MGTTFAERITAALAGAGKSRADLARVLRSPKGTMGISNSGVGQLLAGDSKSMTAENCARAARYLGVSIYWLATCEGPMRGAPNASTMAAEPPPAWGITNRQALDQLADAISALPAALHQPAADMLCAWAKLGMPGGAEDRRPGLLMLLDQARAQVTPGKRQA